jgi:hypothetical protein
MFLFKVGVHVPSRETYRIRPSERQKLKFECHRIRPTTSTLDIISWGDQSDMYEAAEIRSHPLYQSFSGCLSLDPENCSDKIGRLLPRRPSVALAFQQEALGEKALP